MKSGFKGCMDTANYTPCNHSSKNEAATLQFWMMDDDIMMSSNDYYLS